jgi:hypothetical protein
MPKARFFHNGQGFVGICHICRLEKFAHELIPTSAGPKCRNRKLCKEAARNPLPMESPQKGSLRQVRHKADPEQWGYIDGSGTLTTNHLGVTYQIVRVMWANDKVRQVPPPLQYEEDLEEIGVQG